ncbi:MAG: hypothetical protein JWN76_2815 [Chitinophagaceae bacterium]|nr:hypothetical protein [Chitinophagaceae bacterium]
MSTIYVINKGVNKPVEFRGLKGQYIWWLGIGLATLLILFALMYICGVHTALCLSTVFTGAVILFQWVYKTNAKYGQHGMMKSAARKYIPKAVKCGGRFQ